MSVALGICIYIIAVFTIAVLRRLAAHSHQSEPLSNLEPEEHPRLGNSGDPPLATRTASPRQSHAGTLQAER